MRSPLRVEYFSDLNRNKDSSRTFPRVWCRAFAMGSPYGSSVVFPPTRSERSLLWIAGRYSFRMGSPFSGQVLNDLISSEGITTVGLLGAFFRAVLGGEFPSSFGRPVCSEVGEGSTFSCLRFWQGLCVYPSRQQRSGSWPFFFFWPCCLSPSPGELICFGGIAVIHFTWAFHVLVLHAWWLARGSSGSRTSRNGRLVYYQGASDSLSHPSPGREVEASVFGLAVRALLQATSLPSPAPGQELPVSAFKGCNSVLKAFSF